MFGKVAVIVAQKAQASSSDDLQLSYALQWRSAYGSSIFMF